MLVEPFQSRHLPAIQSWWAARDQGTMPEGILPPVGRVAVDDHGPAAAAFLYEPTGCDVAIIDWLVSRPGLQLSAARLACRLILSALEDHARSSGRGILFASVTRESMRLEAVACGFHLAEPNAIHLAKTL